MIPALCCLMYLKHLEHQSEGHAGLQLQVGKLNKKYHISESQKVGKWHGFFMFQCSMVMARQ